MNCSEWKRKYKKERAEKLQERAGRIKAEATTVRQDDQIAILERRVARAERQAADSERRAARAERSEACLSRQLAELRKQVNIHDNPHTPPSHRTPTQEKMGRGRAGKKDDGKKNGTASGRKQGAQKGHPGKTSRPKPERFEEHVMHECAECSSPHILATEQRIRDITELPPPPKPVTTRHTINVYDCADCGAHGMMPDTDLPDKGALGRRASAEIVGNFIERLPHRLNAARMARIGLPVSTGTVHNVLARVGSNMESKVAAVLAVLVAASVLHVDETSFRLNGKIVWVWIFLDPATGVVMYVLRPSRGRDVLNEVLPGFRGTIVCDGWQPYRQWKIQRCWAHILREIRYLCEAHPHSEAARDIYERLKRVFESGGYAAEHRMSRARRARVRAALLGHVTRILDDHGNSALAAKFMTKLSGAAEDLFEFVLDPRIDATNNAAERGLREIVIHRKIRGTLRSPESMQNLGNIFTCVGTWKNTGMDYMAELQKYA